MKITDALIENCTSSNTYKKGLEYFREGRVHLKKRENNLLSAVVDGEHLYNVTIKFTSDQIADTLCTCPYFETMHSNCKHIVAVLKQRQTELLEGSIQGNENSHIAQNLCSAFTAKDVQSNVLHFKFHLFINQPTPNESYFSMAVETDKESGYMAGIENFLEHYSTKQPYTIERQISYIPGITEFVSPQKEILDILSETYENKVLSDNFKSKAVYQTNFGQSSAIRILKLLKTTGFTLTHNGINIPDIRITEGNPDIIIDINAIENGICLSVNERGYALTNDCSYFLYDGIIYETTSDWQEYFRPIYNALATESRTQITFEGNNILPFATYVLPKIRGKHGVITQNIDDIIVDEKPQFEIYFDLRKTTVSAVIFAKYGNISHRLPLDTDTSVSKIVVRDMKSETNILSYFSDFYYKDGTFFIDNDDKLYSFLRYSLSDLKKYAKIISSVSFENIISNRVQFNFSVSYVNDIDLLQADFDTNLSDEELLGILESIQLKKGFYRLNDGSFMLLDTDDSSYFELFNQLDFTKDDIINRRKKLITAHALYLNSLSYITKKNSFNEYIKKIKSTKAIIPTKLKKVLRGYQKTGLDWFKQLSSLGFGGILADEMGLGKTLQVLAYISGEKPKSPVLIITPSALTYNWQNEIKRFTPDLNVKVADGTKSERINILSNLQKNDIVITSYALLRRDIAQYTTLEFSYCFIDEAQNIKNPKTKNSLSVKKIKAGRKFALTGTPIENSLSELWSIFDFVMPGYLGSLAEFRNMYMPSAEKTVSNSALVSLRQRVKPFILRRLKSDVLTELPEKIEHIIYAELCQEQKNIYSAYLALARRKTLSVLKNGSNNKIQILSLLTRLRQICCHPSLFDENYSDKSGKFDLLTEIIDEALNGGHRILIFSQYTSMLSIIRDYLEKNHIKSFYMDGKTPSYERLEMTDRFNYGERDIFLISLKAGGTGLNLVGADTVIHYDPWWNPAVMDQASDRAHRIGQTKPLQVIKLVSKGTIEEKILHLQESKRSIANDIIQINNDTLSSLSNEEILSLFDDI